MGPTLNETVNLIVLDDCQRINQQFIAEAIRIWDTGHISDVFFRSWIEISVYQQWLVMMARN